MRPAPAARPRPTTWWAACWLLGPSEADLVEVLGGSGVADPADAARRLGILRDGPRTRRLSAAGRREFLRAAPLLLAEVLRTPAPDLTLRRLESFIMRSGARATLYTLLAENPPSARALVQLLGLSPYLADLLVRQPALFEGLVWRDAGAGATLPEPEALAAEVLARVRRADHVGDAVAALRAAQTEHLLDLSLRFLSDEIDTDAVQDRCTALARAAVQGCLELAVEEVAARFGRPTEGAGAAVLGLGALGGGELQPGSDLDVVFLHTGVGHTDGERQLDTRTWATRVARKTIALLESPSTEGPGYEVDARLRPTGANGPVVVSAGGYAAWFGDRARPWQRLASLKGRIVGSVGEPPPEGWASAESAGFVGALDPSGIAEEALEMIRRQQAQLDPAARGSDPKRGLGGLATIDFALGCLSLAGGAEAPRRPRGRLAGLREHAREGRIEPAEAALLEAAVRELQRATLVARLSAGEAVATLDRLPARPPSPPVDRDAVAELCGHLIAGAETRWRT